MANMDEAGCVWRGRGDSISMEREGNCVYIQAYGWGVGEWR
jgi:hypothetical protein